MKKFQHVAPRGDGKWGVRSTGSTKADRVFGTQSEAISFAKKRAKTESRDVIIHNNDGSVRRTINIQTEETKATRGTVFSTKLAKSVKSVKRNRKEIKQTAKKPRAIITRNTIKTRTSKAQTIKKRTLSNCTTIKNQ